MAGTIGMGNIAGVALAIQIGGPGAIFGCGRQSLALRPSFSPAHWQ